MKTFIAVLSITLGLTSLPNFKSFTQVGDTTHTNNAKNSIVGAQILGKRQGEFTKEEILNSLGLVPGGDDSLTYKIVSYKCTIIIDGNDPIELENNNGGELTAEMRNAISKATPGSKIYFEYIRCELLSNHMIRTQPPITIRVK